MQKIFFIVTSLFLIQENEAQVYSIIDGTSSQKLSSYKATEIKNTYVLINFSSIKFSKRLGVFINYTKTIESVDYGGGLIFSSDTARIGKKHTYIEYGLGAGFTKSTINPNTSSLYYSQTYFWYENKTDDMCAKGKIIIQANPAYTFHAEEPFYLYAYMAYGITKNIALRVQYLTGSVKGVGLELNLPLCKSFLFRVYGITGDNTVAGASLIFQK